MIGRAFVVGLILAFAVAGCATLNGSKFKAGPLEANITAGLGALGVEVGTVNKYGQKIGGVAVDFNLPLLFTTLWGAVQEQLSGETTPTADGPSTTVPTDTP